MEFPSLGSSCTIQTCKTLDFLPFTCKHCQSIFCKDHFNPSIHQCEVFLKEQDSRNLKDDEINGSIDKIPCFQCKKRCVTLEIIDCNECKSKFCYQHRLQEDHNCIKLKKETMVKSEKPIINIKEIKVRGAKNEQNEKIKLKVALMKLKQKAKGMANIPDSERVYFYIENQINNNSIHEYFLCKKWSIGRCIFYLADDLKIKNNNDRIDHDKLVLKIDKKDENYLRFENTIEDFINQNQLFNGQQLVICYQKY